MYHKVPERVVASRLARTVTAPQPRLGPGEKEVPAGGNTMSEQYQSGGTGQTAQPYGQAGTQRYAPVGQTQQGQQTGQRMGQQQVGGGFHAQLPTEFRAALEDLAKVSQIAEWCTDQCIQDGMTDCARACKDLADLAELNERLIARDSVTGPQVADAYLQVTQQLLPTLQQYQQSPHVSETLSTVTRSVDSFEHLLSTIGQQPPSRFGGGGQPPRGQFGGGGRQFAGGGRQQIPAGQGSFQQGTY